MSQKTALVLGSNGRFGRHAMTEFQNRGWAVRVFDRKTQDLMTQARGADVIINGWNPQYQDWHTQVPRLTKQVIAAAKDSGAIVVVPGNVYVFGTQPGPWSAKTPKTPVNQLGKIRADMEDAFRAANIPLILLRAGDFIDTQASGNWFDMILTKSLGRGRLTYPGLPNIQHNWAYLPDYARAVVDLCEANLGLRPNIELGFPGYNLTGQDLAQSLNKVTQREVVLKEMSWIPLRLAAPFWPLAKEILTMRYLWNHPHSLDTSDFTTALPEFQSTDISSALKKALA